jgi:uncharacterized protein YfbU (UPF0304 family)
MNKTNKQLLSSALSLLHTLEDRTGYENIKLGKAISTLQNLLHTHITEIKSIIDKWGGVTVSELQLEASPVYNSFSKDIVQLVERFNRTDVTILCYVHDLEVDEFNVEYERLNEPLVNEIYDILIQYNVSMEKSFDNENKFKNEQD